MIEWLSTIDIQSNSVLKNKSFRSSRSIITTSTRKSLYILCSMYSKEVEYFNKIIVFEQYAH